MQIEALAWWAERMGELLPARHLLRQPGWDDALVVAASDVPDAPAMLLLRRNRQETLLGHFGPEIDRAALNGRARARIVLLRPPRGALLEKQLVLPLAARRELRRAVGYEMDRVTPFAPGDVFWNCTVTHHDRSRRSLHVRLSLVPKATLAPLLGALDRARLTPAALEVLPAAGPPRLIPLRQETEHVAWQQRAILWLAGACGALGVVAAALPFLLQSLALGAVADRIAAVQPQVAEVQALRQRIAAATAGQDAIADERRKLGDTLEVLALVTQLLPDDTFLNDLSLRQRRLTIAGQSAAAPKLIAALAADPMFRNPAFAAPVTRNVAAGRDVFSISTEVGQ